MTTYTIMNHHGQVIGQGFSIEDCAREILVDDGREWDLRADEWGHTLWDRKQVANIGWWPTQFTSDEQDYDAAFSDIANQVCLAGLHGYHVVTDEMYAEFLKQIAEEEELED